jgi:hypothetical protein
MIVYLANKTRFREDILSNRIEEIVHDSSTTRSRACWGKRIFQTQPCIG